MAEELLESEAVEEETLPSDEATQQARPLPDRPRSGTEVSAWKGEVRTAALAAAGGLVAGAATVAVVRASRTPGAAKAGSKLLRRSKKDRVVASRSFLVDVHLLDR